MPLIEVVEASFSYQGKEALKKVSMTVEAGSFVSILGPNGSGKSTLAKLLNAILRPTSGKVLVEGRDSLDQSNVFRIRSLVGLVMQNPDSQLIADSVIDDVAFGPENMGLEKAEIERRVERALSVCGIRELAELSPSRLSGGQKQLVAIAGVLAMGPRCLVLDEATSMLDPQSRSLVLSKVVELNREEGLAVILLTHDPGEANLADVVHVMHGGRLEKSGSPSAIFSEEAWLESIGIGIPIAYKMNNSLKRKGININSDIINVNKIVYELSSRRSGC